MKRGFDIAVALTLLMITLPVILLAAVLSAVSLRSWPFFTQDRIGKDGKRFKFIKLRTLPTHAPRYADKYELADLRLPWFSRILRRLHLDELPQLLLVLTGKMSLVGPRPEMPYLHDDMQPGFAAMRTSVRPGCTGLWQVSVHCGAMIFENPEYDEFYLRHHTVRFDAWILWRTALIVTPGGGDRLIRLDSLPAWVRPVAPATEAPQSTATSEQVLQTADA